MSVPAHGAHAYGPVLRLIAWLLLKLSGWEVDTPAPAARKFVMIAAPHTSNWDLPFMLMVAVTANQRLNFMVKKEAFIWPLSWFLESVGGIPIIRSQNRNMVGQMIDRFGALDEMGLAVQPEGTRKRMEYWKSGFYRIAHGAGVPLVCGYLDYGRKKGGFGLVVTPTGDLKADMDTIRAYYADRKGKYPELFGPVRLEEEDAPSKGATAA